MITNALCNSFKLDLLSLENPHRPEDVYKIALYDETAELDEGTEFYTALGEVPESGEYVAGGQILEGFSVTLDGHTAVLDWRVDPSWQASIAAAGALIYNSSRGDKALAVLAFDGLYASVDEVFTIIFPPATADAALIAIR